MHRLNRGGICRVHLPVVAFRAGNPVKLAHLVGHEPSEHSTSGISHLVGGSLEGRASWLVVSLCEGLAVSIVAPRCESVCARLLFQASVVDFQRSSLGHCGEKGFRFVSEV